MLTLPLDYLPFGKKSVLLSKRNGVSSALTFRLCLERVRHENQGIVVLAKSFLARLAGQLS
jgi:hypothetical protein